MLGRMLGRMICVAAAMAAGLSGCRSAGWHRQKADRAAQAALDALPGGAGGLSGAVLIAERPSDTLRRRLFVEQELPTAVAPSATNAAPAAAAGPLKLTLVDALKIGTRNSREYQKAKEEVFTTALELDLESNAFRTQFTGLLSGALTEDRSADPARRAVEGGAEAGVARTFENGLSVTTQLAFDLVKLLTLDRESAYGLLADASVTVPLLRGRGRDIVREPLTQAERNTQYAVWTFERFRRRYAVNVAQVYLVALQRMVSLRNYEENLRSLGESTRRAEQLAAAGRLPEIQVDQARQDELRSRDRFNAARQESEQALDELKTTLGLPVDARIELDAAELDRLGAAVEQMEKNRVDLPAWVPSEREALRRALDERLDLQIARGGLEDARRGVKIAEDALRAGLSLKLSGSAGGRRSVSSAAQGDATLKPDRGVYGATLGMDLPWERTAERVNYREQLIAAARAERAAESAEDAVKTEVRDGLRTLTQAREACRIQVLAVAVARRRVDSTLLLQQAGRVEMRYLLEAREALLSAQLALTQAVVQYRLAELGLRRDMESLKVSEEGLWDEPR